VCSYVLNMKIIEVKHSLYLNRALNARIIVWDVLREALTGS
jgi:hypothetical protein